MNRLKISCFVASLALIALLPAKSHSQGFLKAKDQQIVNEAGKPVILRGIGLGGWMLQEGYMLRINSNGQQYKIRERIQDLIGEKQTQEFYDTWLANHTTKRDIDSLKAWGFNSVRLPMHYNLYTLPIEKEPVQGQQTWLDKGFALTDSLLAWCKANNMYLILDLHATPGGQGNDLNISDRDTSKPSLWDSEANQQKTVALWKQLASRYANEPYIAGYDLINEPNWGFEDKNDRNGQKEQKNAPLRKLLMEITAAIRSVDKKHIIIIEGNAWGNNYKGMLPTWDDNMVLSYHKYWNNNDEGSIRHMLETREKYNVPVWLGETGENSNVWFTEAIRLLESHQIGWAWWPLKKLGANNPLQIRSNPNYDDLVAYWSGQSKHKPKESNAYSGLLELAAYTNIRSNIVHRDVVDAMIRQPFNPTAIPFSNHRLTKGYILKAVDYDLGSNGVAYFDTDTADYHISSGQRGGGNRGRTYRNDGVDIRKEESRYESYYITDTEAGEWLQYTVDVPANATYIIELLTGGQKGGKITLSTGNTVLAKEVEIPAAKSPEDWQTVTLKNITLKKGKQTIRILTGTGGFTLKEIRFK